MYGNMENFLQYQHENNYIRRHDFQQYPKENYKMSMHSLRKNPHAGDPTPGRVKHLLRRRADGRSVHTPDHIESQRKRHELFAKLSPPKFDIIKVRHLDQRHHEKHREKLKNKEKRRIERAHRRKYQNGKSIANPINHMHHDTGTHAEFIPRKPGRKLSKYDTLSSYNVGRALLHAPGQAGRSRPIDGNTKCFCRRNMHTCNNNRLPPNSLLYGWGAVSQRISTSGRIRTGKKLLGPSLKAALALSPRAYPDRLPKHLEVRRRPQEEYRAERQEVRRLRNEKEEAKKKTIMMNKKKRMLPKEGRSRRHQQNGFVLEHDLLKELKQSILHLPPLSSQSQSAR